MSDDDEELPAPAPDSQECFLGDTQLLRIDGTKERVTNLRPGDRVSAAMGGHVTVSVCGKLGKRKRELKRIITTATEMLCTPGDPHRNSTLSSCVLRHPWRSVNMSFCQNSGSPPGKVTIKWCWTNHFMVGPGPFVYIYRSSGV